MPVHSQGVEASLFRTDDQVYWKGVPEILSGSRGQASLPSVGKIRTGDEVREGPFQEDVLAPSVLVRLEGEKQMIPRHPKTGRRYRQVFPWPTDIYCDWRDAYARLSSEVPWVSDHEETEIPKLLSESEPQDVLILWHDLLPPGASQETTRAKLILYWPETVGSGIGMTVHQTEMLRELVARRARAYSGIIFYDPDSKDFLSPVLPVPAGVSPAGYDAQVMGQPDWNAPKTTDIALYGAFTGIREWIIPDLRARMDGRLDEFSGIHKKARAARLSSSRSILIVPHSPGSFPQWRLWHAIASSAALLAPWPKAWPAESGKHYIEVPFPDPARPGPFLDAIMAALGRSDLSTVARTAHEEISKITVARAFEEWTVPEIERMLSR